MEQRKISDIRFILNTVFILLALVAMIGVMAFPNGSIGLGISYAVALIAIVVKMIEVCFRMPMKGNKKF